MSVNYQLLRVMAFLPSVSLFRIWITVSTPFLTQPPNSASKPFFFSTSYTKRKEKFEKITKLDFNNVSILNIKFVIHFIMMNLSLCLLQNFHSRSLCKKLIGVSTKYTNMYKNTYVSLFERIYRLKLGFI